MRIRSSSCCFSASFLALSLARSFLILFNSARSAAVSSSESLSSEFSLSTGSSASGFCSNFWRLAFASIARRTTAEPCLPPDLLSRSRSSNSLRRSRLRTSSLVVWPVSLKILKLLAGSSFIDLKPYLNLSFVWPGKSRDEYCFERADKSFSFPRAVSNVGLAAVVILIQVFFTFKWYFLMLSYLLILVEWFKLLIEDWFNEDFNKISK